MQEPAVHRHPDVVGRRRGDPRVQSRSRGDRAARVHRRPCRAIEMHDRPGAHCPDVSGRRAVDVGEPQRHSAPIHLRPALPVPVQDDAGREVGPADRPDVSAARAPEAGDRRLEIERQLCPIARGVPVQQSALDGAPDLSGRGDPHSEDVLALRERVLPAPAVGFADPSKGIRRGRAVPACRPSIRPTGVAVPARRVHRSGRRVTVVGAAVAASAPGHQHRRDHARDGATLASTPSASPTPTHVFPLSGAPPPRPCPNVVSMLPGTHGGYPVLRAEGRGRRNDRTAVPAEWTRVAASAAARKRRPEQFRVRPRLG